MFQVGVFLCYESISWYGKEEKKTNRKKQKTNKQTKKVFLKELELYPEYISLT